MGGPGSQRAAVTATGSLRARSRFVLLIGGLSLAVGSAPACVQVVCHAEFPPVLCGQQVMDGDVYVGQLTTDDGRTWAQTKTSLSRMSTKPVDADDVLRRAAADIDGARLTVVVESYERNRSQIHVSATKSGASAGEAARLVFERIVDDLDRANAAGDDVYAG